MDTKIISANPSAGCRLVVSDGTVLSEEIINLTYSTGCSSAATGPSLGSTVAANCTTKLAGSLPILEGKDVTLEVQADDGSWAPLGRFRFQTPEVGEETTTVTAVDAMLAVLEAGYFPSSPAPATALGVLRDVCEQSGLVLGDVSGFTDVPISGSLTGCTCREMVGYMAALLGRNAIIGRSGALELIWYNPSEVTIRPDCYYSGGFTRKDYDWTLSGLTVSTGTGENDTLSAGTAGSVISFSNPYMTQAQLNKLWTRLQGFAYRPGEATLLGNLEIEPGDLVTIIDRSGSSYTLAVMAVEHSYDGGWKTKLTAYGAAENDTSAGYKGPLTTAMERYTAQMASFQQLYAQDMTVVNGQITNLEAQNANLQDLIATKADVEDLTAANAAIGNLAAQQANIKDLVAEKADLDDLHATDAHVDELTAGLANVETLLAGSAGVGELQVIHLTGDNVVIDEAIITDAMIAGLSAGKITAGQIITDLVQIASKSGRLLLDGETLQIRDAAGTVRVQIGKNAAGDYSYYLWDAQGNLMWSPTGVTADGLNEGIIRDVNVAPDAAISGDKLNISSVAQKLNEDGSLQVDAGQVTIDDTKLDVAYKTVLNQVEDMSTRTTALETDFKVVQGQITSKVWQTDIETATGGRNLFVQHTLTSGYRLNSDGTLYSAPDHSVSDYIPVSPDTNYTLTVYQDHPSDTGYLSVSYYTESKSHIERTVMENDWAAGFSITQKSPPNAAYARVSIVTALSDAVQFQWGSRSTSYQIAPEDTDAALTTMADQYSRLDQTVDGISLSVGNLQTAVTEQGSTITEVRGELALKIGRDENDQIVSMLNASADQINLTGQRLTIDSPNFKLAADGTITATEANLSGEVTAETGRIGGFVIDGGSLYGNDSYVTSAGTEESVTFWLHGVPSISETGVGSPNLTYVGAWDGTPRAMQASLRVDLKNLPSGGGASSFDRLLLRVTNSSTGRSGELAVTAYGVEVSGNETVTGNLAAAGSLSTYGVTVPRIQHGRVTQQLTANVDTDITITFPRAFPGIPSVTITPQHDSAVTSLLCKLRSVSASGCVVYLRSSGSGNHVIHWQAMYS